MPATGQFIIPTQNADPEGVRRMLSQFSAVGPAFEIIEWMPDIVRALGDAGVVGPVRDALESGLTPVLIDAPPGQPPLVAIGAADIHKTLVALQTDATAPPAPPPAPAPRAQSAPMAMPASSNRKEFVPKPIAPRRAEEEPEEEPEPGYYDDPEEEPQPQSRRAPGRSRTRTSSKPRGPGVEYSKANIEAFAEAMKKRMGGPPAQ
jgi:hypothetical protein